MFWPGVVIFYILTFVCFEQETALRVDKSYLLGQYDPSSDRRFVKPDAQYTSGAARSQYLRRETYKAFQKMSAAAEKEGVKLIILSATRNFETQKSIWENKWKAEAAIINPADRALKILQQSSMPGTSRHHWGTDMDLNSLDNDYFASGEGLRVYQWLTTHAHKFGFCQPYTSKSSGRTGYDEEKWHWSFKPLSASFLNQYISVITLADITGFQGSETATEVDVIKYYVAGVACK